MNVNFDMQSFTARTERHDRGAPLAPYGAGAASGRLQPLRDARKKLHWHEHPSQATLRTLNAHTRHPIPQPSIHAPSSLDSRLRHRRRARPRIRQRLHGFFGRNRRRQIHPYRRPRPHARRARRRERRAHGRSARRHHRRILDARRRLRWLEEHALGARAKRTR